ncbi:DUF2628 domain-containing protein [Methylocystis parvus]|uniref:DUF2628 domain-containing protein n=1 Tax=Methylocystis parvus TaxID=134 RepID=A0A6B8M1Q1_9HYPH|nr:DUF2628 domain-containing protein [Methylocystis parvus]QGM96225.1 DUF2628 domain-containing protein [Methylocystis parvus]WBJ99944.1 DUF2628 domain-containing protein [Methylocystis parvus OBBP]
MAVFTVHLPPAGVSEPEKIRFLREGFSFPAFAFGPFWLLWKRAWLAAVGWTLLLVVIGVGGYVFKMNKDAMSFLGMASALILGFEGDRLLAWSLQRRGYAEGDVVIADNEDEAEEVYFGRLRAASLKTLPAESGA